jgi:hypothetical protein
MKQKIIMALLVIGSITATIYSDGKTKSQLGLESVSVEAAEKKWGSTPFTAPGFKKADEKRRASMVAALIRTKNYLGKPFSLVRHELGEYDGYFQRDSIPAYSIESARTGSKEAWLVVFLPDPSGKKVGEVKILKECCD